MIIDRLRRTCFWLHLFNFLIDSECLQVSNPSELLLVFFFLFILCFGSDLMYMQWSSAVLYGIIVKFGKFQMDIMNFCNLLMDTLNLGWLTLIVDEILWISAIYWCTRTVLQLWCSFFVFFVHFWWIYCEFLQFSDVHHENFCKFQIHQISISDVHQTFFFEHQPVLLLIFYGYTLNLCKFLMDMLWILQVLDAFDCLLNIIYPC